MKGSNCSLRSVDISWKLVQLNYLPRGTMRSLKPADPVQYPMPSASLPPTPPADGTSRGLVKGHRIALCPNDWQASLMAEHAGWARVASNWAIDRFAKAWFTSEGEENVWSSDMDLRKQFNAVKRDLFAWSVYLSRNVAKNAVIDTGKGLEAWGAYRKALKKGQRPRRVGFPKHRKRGRHMSFTPTNGRNIIRVEGCRVRIPDIGWVCMREPLRFAGDILSATVSLVADHWHTAFQVDTGEPEPPKRPGPTVGVDMGIQVLATLWDGDERTQILNPRPLQEALYAQRRRQHARVSHLRNDHHHRATTAIAKRGGTVKVETLHLAGMQRNRRLGRALSDAGLGEFVRQLEYKCAWYGTACEKVDRWYPSSKTCSACGAVKQSLLLSERIYRCLRCGFACDRDENPPGTSRRTRRRGPPAQGTWRPVSRVHTAHAKSVKRLPGSKSVRLTQQSPGLHRFWRPEMVRRPK